MKVLYLILVLIGVGIFAALVLSTLMVVLVIAVAGWLATLAPPFGKQRGSLKKAQQTL